jgi:glyoxylase-like metal-dependent hydrolase (beta-lactamase superfamily II)
MRNRVRSTLSRRGLLQGAAAAIGAGVAGGIGTDPAQGKAPLIQVQAPAFYRFKVGAYQAIAVSDGPLQLGPPSADVFIGMSQEDMNKKLHDSFLSTERVALDQNALVINTGNTVVLFDTGLGTNSILGPDTGRLIAGLMAAGIDPKDVDAIALTHAHPDHCWALMGEDGTRNFPNAQIYMAQVDFDFWTDEAKLGNEKLKAFIETTRKQLLPNRDRVVFVKEGQEIIPGIRALAAPGHTVGHTIYMITSDGQSICNVGDIAHHYVLMLDNPRLEFAYDTDGKQAVASRLRVFDMLAATRTLMIAYHFPWPGIGHIAKQGDGYRYFPTPMRMAPL